MNELISKSALLPEICKACNNAFGDYPCEPVDCDICFAIKKAPVVDAVPVVRCEKCIWHNECKFEQYQGLNGFCSLGERKGSELDE